MTNDIVKYLVKGAAFLASFGFIILPLFESWSISRYIDKHKNGTSLPQWIISSDRENRVLAIRSLREIMLKNYQDEPLYNEFQLILRKYNL